MQQVPGGQNQAKELCANTEMGAGTLGGWLNRVLLGHMRLDTKR